MKKLLALAFIMMLSFPWNVSLYAECSDRKSGSVSNRKSNTAPKTIVIKTDEICQDIIGYCGPTPVEITVVNGKITKVKPMTNRESPGYFHLLVNSDFFNSWNGLTLKQAVEKPVDAVSGATLSSRAVIENVRKGAATQLKKNGK